MKILVVGTGGVGGYFGARLAADGNEVTFVLRGAHRAAVEAEGLKVTSPLGDLHLDRPQIYDSPEKTGLCDIVMLCTKMWGLADAIETVRPLVGHDTAVIPFQNGVDAENMVIEALGRPNAVGGVAQIAAHIAAPGHIHHGGKLARLVFGELDGTRSRRLEAFLAACEAAGIDAKLSDDIGREIWTKFVMLTGMAGATAFYRDPIGEIMADPEKKALHRNLVLETAALARARGVALKEGLEEKLIAASAAMPAGTKASMALDLERGNRLELPWLNGAVARLGVESGIATPSHDRVVASLEPFAMGQE